MLYFLYSTKLINSFLCSCLILTALNVIEKGSFKVFSLTVITLVIKALRLSEPTHEILTGTKPSQLETLLVPMGIEPRQLNTD